MEQKISMNHLGGYVNVGNGFPKKELFRTIKNLTICSNLIIKKFLVHSVAQIRLIARMRLIAETKAIKIYLS